MKGKNLVIVESPTKAKTISKFLGSEYKIESSFGHIRDLPKSKLGVDVEHNFEPQYVIPTKSRQRANELKKLADKAQTIYFATDEDREGEAISWHLVNIFKTPQDKVKRIVFHEITEEAIKEALKNPRTLDLNLVDAQQARRVLDRLVGYQLSPFLWKKVARGLSAGRVQSVAVRLIVEREREIQAFKPEEYWSIESIFEAQGTKFESKLHKIKDQVIDKLEIKNQAQAENIIKDLTGAKYQIEKVEKRQTKKRPLPPFTTSTLQQAANARLGFSAKQTMMLAQQLYEGIELGSGGVGLITYMRTDSLNLAQKFLDEAGNYIKDKFGNNYHDEPKRYKAKSKLAQEAHEAIRPTLAENAPEKIKPHLNERQFKLYQLIWQRAIASQMADAITDNTTVDIKAADTVYTFRSTGSVIKFDGFLKVYPTNTKENILPDVEEKDQVNLVELKPEQHFTQPPARYSEATLVKALEEYGIGRPSTYAPTISTVQDRGYVEKEDKRLKPTDIAYLVNDLLVEHFPEIVDYKFTANMEDDLDEIAEGKKKWQPIIHEFWGPFKTNLDKKELELDKKKLTEEKTDEVCEKCGKPMVIKIGRYGKFLACTGYPDCKNTKQLGGEGNEPQTPEVTGETCPDCGKPLVKRRGRFGEFVGCSGYPDCKYIKKEAAQTFGTCPKCGKGKIVGKRSRRGFFYACDQYPECKNALWGKPHIKEGKTEPETCPDCGAILVEGGKDAIKCSNKDCSYKE
ncbi:MAG: type I DNA topoisomerase [Patescibacteria group bacterium]|jgi:DNA topoisomerase-1|nr:type I DNA topoisomerase [Patescibacteria group bacterium]